MCGALDGRDGKIRLVERIEKGDSDLESPLNYCVCFDKSFSIGFSNSQILIRSMRTQPINTMSTFSAMCIKT